MNKSQLIESLRKHSNAQNFNDGSISAVIGTVSSLVNCGWEVFERDIEDYALRDSVTDAVVASEDVFPDLIGKPHVILGGVRLIDGNCYEIKYMKKHDPLTYIIEGVFNYDKRRVQVSGSHLDAAASPQTFTIEYLGSLQIIEVKDLGFIAVLNNVILEDGCCYLIDSEFGSKEFKYHKEDHSFTRLSNDMKVTFNDIKKYATSVKMIPVTEPPVPEKVNVITKPEILLVAPDMLSTAAETIGDRASERDTEAERSMLTTVEAFNAMYGTELTEEQGWMFMVFLKASRAKGGNFRDNDYIDGAAYFALAGECAAKQR